MLWRKRPERIAKVGVEGSNPFARSNFLPVPDWPTSARQAADEIDDRGIDLVRPLLLGPVTATSEHLYAAQSRYEAFEIGQELIHAGSGRHEVAVAREV